MSNTNTGGPAFPTPRYERGDMYSIGMTLRDYFAAKALQGMLAENGGGPMRNNTLAEFSYEIADAMLKARES